MNIRNNVVTILTISLASMVMLAACSKNTGKKNADNAGKKTPIVKTEDIVSKEKSILNASRRGQYVDLNWRIEEINGNIKQLELSRSATGLKNRRRIAELEPNKTSFRDCLPNADAQWYWLRIVTTDKKMQEIGPVRVDADGAGSANYVNIEDKYKIVITRTDEQATLRWDFPDDKYKEINIVRFPKPVVVSPFSGSGYSVLTTLEWKSQHTATMPNPNKDFWYWFRIKLQSGEIYYKGPIKAEFAS